MYQRFSTTDTRTYVDYIVRAPLRNRILHDIIPVRQICGRNHNGSSSADSTQTLVSGTSRSGGSSLLSEGILSTERHDQGERSRNANVSSINKFFRRRGDDSIGTTKESAQGEDCSSCRKIIDEIWKKIQKYWDISNKYHYQGALLSWTEHYSEKNTHVHIIHDCGFTNSTCRCAVLSGLPIKRRSGRSRTASEYTANDWYETTEYLRLRTGERGRYNIYMANYGGRALCKGGDLRREKDGTTGRETSMDFQDPSIQFCDESQHKVVKRAIDESTSVDSKKSRPQKKSTSYSDEKTQKVFQFLWNNLVVPIEHCMTLPTWLEDDDLVLINGQNDVFKLGIDIYKRKIVNFSLMELYNHYVNKPLYFSETTGNLNKMYHTLDVSTDYINKFLSFQCHDNEDAKLEFISTLYNVLSKSNGKKNAIWLYGPPDCGKSYFVETLRGLMITSGSTSIMNRTNNFPFNTLVNVRLAILDELSYDPAIYTDPLKMLLGGNTIYVSKKYCDDIPIHKTPVIIMSNTQCIPDTEAFKSRISKYTWMKCNTNVCSGMFEKLLHPFCIINLFKMYSIITNDTE